MEAFWLPLITPPQTGHRKQPISWNGGSQTGVLSRVPGLVNNQTAGPHPQSIFFRSRAGPESPGVHTSRGRVLSCPPHSIPFVLGAFKPGGVGGEGPSSTRTQAGTTHSSGHLEKAVTLWHPHCKENIGRVGWAGEALGNSPFLQDPHQVNASPYKQDMASSVGVKAPQELGRHLFTVIFRVKHGTNKPGVPLTPAYIVLAGNAGRFLSLWYVCVSLL